MFCCADERRPMTSIRPSNAAFTLPAAARTLALAGLLAGLLPADAPAADPPAGPAAATHRFDLVTASEAADWNMPHPDQPTQLGTRDLGEDVVNCHSVSDNQADNPQI